MLQSLGNNFLKYVNRKMGGQKYLSLQIDITNACNLRCAHCYHDHHKNNGALDLDQWKQVIDQYENLLNKLLLEPSITICGGEPTISPLLFPLLNYIKQKFKNTEVNILSNGTTIDEKFIQKIKNYNLNFQVSLDGPNHERHDGIRGKGNFDRAIQGIKLLRTNHISVHILAILSKKTSSWIENFFVLAKKLNVTSMNFTRFIPSGYGKKLKQSGSDDVLLGFDLKRALEGIVEQSKKYDVSTNTDKPLFNLIDKNLGMSAKFGFQGMVVNYKGNLKVSSRSDFKLGSVLEDGLEELYLNHPVLKSLRHGQIKTCGTCPHYSRCGGDRNMSYAITGNFLSADIGCWLNQNSKNKDEEVFNEVS